MKSIKSRAMPLLSAAILGLGFGAGFSASAEPPLTCRQQCILEFQECLAEGSNYPGFFRCRTWLSACLQGC